VHSNYAKSHSTNNLQIINPESTEQRNRSYINIAEERIR